MNGTRPPQKKVIPISIAIVIFEDRVLVGKRVETSHLGGMDEFPGGKQEANETADVCAIRECVEETGLQIEIDELLHQEIYDYEDRYVELTFFLCHPINAEETNAMSEPFRWVKFHELDSLSFPSGNDRVLQILCDHFS